LSGEGLPCLGEPIKGEGDARGGESRNVKERGFDRRKPIEKETQTESKILNYWKKKLSAGVGKRDQPCRAENEVEKKKKKKKKGPKAGKRRGRATGKKGARPGSRPLFEKGGKSSYEGRRLPGNLKKKKGWRELKKKRVVRGD